MVLFSRKISAGVIIVQEDEPEDKTIGRIWVDESDSPPSINIADGSNYKMPSFKIRGTTKVNGEALV